MTRQIEDIHLPDPTQSNSSSRQAASVGSGRDHFKASAAARAGSVSAARCRYHKNCAFTGKERGRCPVCHALFDEWGCLGHDSYPAGRTRPCLCTGCDELFSGPSAFGSHQVLRSEERGGGVICRKPDKRGLVLLDKNGWEMWCKPGERPEL